ncbi:MULTISPECIES: hypothetical protein [Acidianus]|uniref:SHSP domain-containing protein n=1 Tax=Candidatus Acidianus copahuensis TaxID=1160895 RepID=A0A031LM11_9CREN|nr:MULTISPECIES: hypothetical protein [Acidianus]EZQ01918.1 hypothetical protein CM19_11765 [Candidatus Acidianus copahuensis]NON61941.1 hypothetical protein [Acidianus sp. RZ1]
MMVEDPEIDVLFTDKKVLVLMDFRDRDLKTTDLLIRADSSYLYVYDPHSNSVVKVIQFPKRVDFSSLQVTEKNGIISVTLLKYT